MEHNQYCIEGKKRQDEWVARWPNHCPSCGGAGYSYDPGVRYHRDGSGTPPSWDACRCVEEGVCPRCGLESEVYTPQDVDTNYYYDLVRCLHCGWDERLSGGPGADGFTPEERKLFNEMAMPGHECDCWIQEEEEAYEQYRKELEEERALLFGRMA